MRSTTLLALAVTLAAPAFGCATYHDELVRGQNTLEQGEHEKALAILRRLENETGHFDAAELARYAYVRGMTDYRIGYRADARHWLALAREIDAQNNGALPANFKSKLEPTLAELDAQVYAQGIASLDRPVEKPKRRPKSSDDRKRGEDKDETKDAPSD